MRIGIEALITSLDFGKKRIRLQANIAGNNKEINAGQYYGIEKWVRKKYQGSDVAIIAIEPID